MPDSITRELQKIVGNKEACLVVGAGISKASCPNESVVTWPGLIDKGLEFLKEVDRANSSSHEAVFAALNRNSGNPSNYLVLGEYIESHLNACGGGFGKWLQSQFDSLQIEDKRVIQAIDGLQLPIITTNYDGTFEQISLRSRCTLSNVTEFVSEMRRSTRIAPRTVFHVHGYYNEPDTIVFGSSSYQRILSNEVVRSLEHALSIFKALIFVGTGAGIYDPHFSALLDWISNNSAISNRVFLLLTDDAETKPYRSIVPVRYGPDYGLLAGYLNELKVLATPSGSPSVSIRAFIDQMELDSTRVDLDTGGHAAIAQALSPIAMDEIEEQARHLLLLERSKAYCKINRFEDALTDAAIVSEYFKDRDPIYRLRAEAVSNTVMRDRELWEDAVAQAKKMVTIAEAADRRKAKAIAYHALARSLALAEKPTEALKYAEQALSQSVTAEEKGEAYFAEGEAYRHGGDVDKAIKAYRKSEKTTFISGKTDLYIWCKLCLADCFLMQANIPESELQLGISTSQYERGMAITPSKACIGN